MSTHNRIKYTTYELTKVPVDTKFKDAKGRVWQAITIRADHGCFKNKMLRQYKEYGKRFSFKWPSELSRVQLEKLT